MAQSAKIYAEHLLSTVLKSRILRKRGREWPILNKKLDQVFLKMRLSQPLFVYFRPFHITIQLQTRKRHG